MNTKVAFNAATWNADDRPTNLDSNKAVSPK
jgi:hypothetical protein